LGNNGRNKISLVCAQNSMRRLWQNPAIEWQESAIRWQGFATLWQSLEKRFAISLMALFLFAGALPASAADLKVEIFYRGLLAEHPSEWAELLVLAPKDSGFPFDMKIPDPR